MALTGTFLLDIIQAKTVISPTLFPLFLYKKLETTEQLDKFFDLVEHEWIGH